MSGPNDYMVDKRDAVRAQKKRTQEAGYPPNRYQARVTADDRSGVRKVRIRDFQFVSDSGPASGGFDFGPTPVELLFASLGSCLVSTFLNQAATRSVPIDTVDIDISGQTDPRARISRTIWMCRTFRTRFPTAPPCLTCPGGRDK